VINDDHRRTKRDQDRRVSRGADGAGHRVLIERGAGVGSSIVDADYVANGATIVDSADDVWAESDLLMKVKEPVAPEYHRLSAHKNQVLFTYLHLAASRECTDALVAANNVAIAYETVRLRDNSLPAAHADERGGRPHGAADGGAPPHAPRRGTRHADQRCARCRPGQRRRDRCRGVSGLAAATMAAGLHANVKILDRNLERLRQVDIHFDGRVQTIASSTLAIEEACLEADIVIGAVLVVGAKAPKLVSNDLVARMRPRLGAGRHLGRPGRLLRSDAPDDALGPRLRGERFDLLLRGEHARRRSPTRRPTRSPTPRCPTRWSSLATDGARPCCRR
jgi:alanine dehydrogenase